MSSGERSGRRPRHGNLRVTQLMLGTGLIAISYILHAPLEIGFLLVLGIVFQVSKSSYSRSMAFVVWIVLLLNIISIGLLVYELRRPSMEGNEAEYFKRYGPFVYLTDIELGQREIEIMGRRQLIPGWARWDIHSYLPENDYTKIDPYTGKEYRKDEAGRYSIGPDGIDDGMRIGYDPTNGTFSRGDLRVTESGV